MFSEDSGGMRLTDLSLELMDLSALSFKYSQY